MTRGDCRKCKARLEGRVSASQMEGHCKGCKYLKRLESPGMTFIPAYAMDVLAETTSNAQPILSRHGMIFLGE